MEEARTILIEALTSAPTSPVTRELRDLLGEINTRLFFSDKTSPRKKEYTVNSGDALSSIARKLQSTTDAIMRVNDLDSTMIRPGEKLVVPQLDFTITIDLPRERVIVHDGHGFFTQYPIAAADLPATRALTLQTKVQAKSFLANGQPLGDDRKPSAEARRSSSCNAAVMSFTAWTKTARRATQESKWRGKNRASPAATSEPNRPPQGIAMLKKDIAQLDLLIRRGTPVTVILDRK